MIPSVDIVANDGMLWLMPPVAELQEDLKFWCRKPVKEAYSYFDRRKGEQVSGERFAGMTGSYEMLYSLTEDGSYMVINEGLFHRVTNVLAANGYGYTYRRIAPLPEFDFGSHILAPMWSEEHQAFLPMRPEQISAVIHLLAASGCGRRGGPTPTPGSGGGLANLTMSTGKTFLIAALIRAFRHLKIVITTYRSSVVRRLYDGLNEILNPEGIQIGMVTGSVKKREDICVCTDKSLTEFDPDEVGLILYDEVHRAGADNTSQDLLAFKKAVKFGFSGTIKSHDRLRYIESIFGPVAYEFEDEEAEALGRVSPVKCYALSVPDGVIVHGANNAQKESRVITNNKFRNQVIQQVAERVPDDMQFIIYVRTIEHIEVLRDKFLPPGYEVYHAELPQKEKLRLEAGIYDGSIKRMIANSSFSEGVDTTKLRVLLNADWTASDQTVSQRGGRNRRNDDGKLLGIIIDLRDDWIENKRKAHLEELGMAGDMIPEDMEKPDNLFTKAKSRISRYKKRGWPVINIDSAAEIDFTEVHAKKNSPDSGPEALLLDLDGESGSV